MQYYLKLYSTENDGMSLNWIAKGMTGYSGPWLLFIRHKEGVIGSYQSGGFK